MKKKNKVVNIEKSQVNIENIKEKVLVNIITGLRTIGSLAIIPIYINSGALFTTGVVSALFMTDFIDGFLARKLHAQSFFGTLLDAVSDKLFAVSTMALLVSKFPIYLIPVALELGIFKINYESIQRGNNVHSSLLGKTKTLILSLSVIEGLIALDKEGFKALLNSWGIKSFDSILNMKTSMLVSMAVNPLIIVECITILDYILRARKQDFKTMANDKKNDEEKKLKSKKEIIHDLFDTEFYLENKDGGIKKLLYK